MALTMCATATLEQTVELIENERRWVGKGFGKGGLLPTDPGPYSSRDGSLSWKSMEKANECLLGRGWVYKENEAILTTDKDGLQIISIDEDDPQQRGGGGPVDSGNGWLYTNDFKVESLKEAKPEKGMLHWVRFRRLIRTKIFLPDEFVPKEIYEKCDHCDSLAIDNLSELLLEILSYCSLLYNMTKAQDSEVLPLKERLIALVFSHKVCKQGSSNVSYELNCLRKKLNDFLDNEISETKMSRLIHSIDFSFHNRASSTEYKQRRDEIAMFFFPKNEADYIAALILRKLDSHFQLHCDKVACGKECRFAPVQCTNVGCSVIMSKVHMDSHDETCSYKIYTCACGDMFPKHELSKHQSVACKLREISCPFANIGCVKITKACDMNQHITDDINSHLLLAVNRMMEYEEQMRKMNIRITTLENENKGLKQSLEQQKAVTKVIGIVDTKLNKTCNALTTLDTNSKSEFKKIRADVEKHKKDSKKEVNNVDTKIGKTILKLEALEMNSVDQFKKIKEGGR